MSNKRDIQILLAICLVALLLIMYQMVFQGNGAQAVPAYLLGVGLTLYALWQWQR